MATPEFGAGLAQLEEIARVRRTAIMCAEAVPWRCHRRLISDALIVRGWEVFDILSSTRIEARELTDFARVRDGAIVYPAADRARD